jgi:hypothetical protein
MLPDRRIVPIDSNVAVRIYRTVAASVLLTGVDCPIANYYGFSRFGRQWGRDLAIRKPPRR